jgi:hypothetical protein
VMKETYHHDKVGPCRLNEETAYLSRRTEVKSWLLDFFLEWLIQNEPRDDTEPILTRRAFLGEGDSGGELSAP